MTTQESKCEEHGFPGRRCLELRDRGAGRQALPNQSVFKEISPPSKLVFDPGDGERVWFEATVNLQETAGGTLVTFRQLYPTEESRDTVVKEHGAIEGGIQHLAKLEAYLEAKLA